MIKYYDLYGVRYISIDELLLFTGGIDALQQIKPHGHLLV